MNSNDSHIDLLREGIWRHCPIPDDDYSAA